MPSRRHVLRAGSAAGLLALAGCSSLADTSSPTDSPTASPTPTPERLAFGEAFDPDDGKAVKATGARVQSSVRRVASTDHNAVEAGAQWYLFVTVDAMPAGPLPDDFEFRTAEGAYDPLAVRDDYVRQRIEYVEGDAYRGMGDEWTGWLLFEVPYDDPSEDARLALDGDATWTLPDAAVERLRAGPPDFSVRGIETPDSPPADEPFDVRVTVANDGGRGTFRGAFNYTAPLYYPQGLAGALDGGAERTFAVQVDVHTGDSGAEAGDEVAATLVSPGEDRSWSVTLG